MTTRSQVDTRLTLTLSEGTLSLRLQIRLRWLLALVAAAVTLSGSPALLTGLARLLTF